MDRDEIMAMADAYAETLIKEHEARVALADAQISTLTVRAQELATAYESGAIDGKNADVRKVQETAFTATNAAILEAAKAEARAALAAAVAEITRKRAEAIISLTRAWLYSQAGTDAA